MNPLRAEESLRLIFKRDMVDNPCTTFNGRRMVYFRDGIHEDIAFDHLIKNKVNGSRNNIEHHRAVRLHWIKPALEKALNSTKYLVFSHKRPGSDIRTYIYHKKMKHVVILEPNIEENEYYLVTSFRVVGNGIQKMKDRYNDRLSELY